MLVLTRRRGQTIIVGNDCLVSITVMSIKDRKVLLGVHAEKDVPILRAELCHDTHENEQLIAHLGQITYRNKKHSINNLQYPAIHQLYQQMELRVQNGDAE